MSTLDDRRRWLDHLSECAQCPVNRCGPGDELAAAVREELDPGQFWEGVYRPRNHEHGPAAAARARMLARDDDAISDADRRRIAQDEAAEGPDTA